MGKKRSKKGGGGDDDWEGASVASESTVASQLGFDKDPEIEKADEWTEAVDMTYESRGSTREKGWERLCNLLRNSVREVRRDAFCAVARQPAIPGPAPFSQVGRLGAMCLHAILVDPIEHHGGSAMQGASLYLAPPQRIARVSATDDERPIHLLPPSSSRPLLHTHIPSPTAPAGVLAERGHHHRAMPGGAEKGQRDRGDHGGDGSG
jgi:hypothetical protein